MESFSLSPLIAKKSDPTPQTADAYSVYADSITRIDHFPSTDSEPLRSLLCFPLLVWTTGHTVLVIPNLDSTLPFTLAMHLTSRWARAVGAASLSRLHFGFVCGFLTIHSGGKFFHKSSVPIMDTFPRTDSSPVVLRNPFQQKAQPLLHFQHTTNTDTDTCITGAIPDNSSVTENGPVVVQKPFVFRRQIQPYPQPYHSHYS